MGSPKKVLFLFLFALQIFLLISSPMSNSLKHNIEKANENVTIFLKFYDV